MAKIYQIEFPPDPNTNWIRAWDPVNKCVRWVRPEDYFGEMEVDVDMTDIVNSSVCTGESGQPLSNLRDVLNYLCYKIDQIEEGQDVGYARLAISKVPDKTSLYVGDTVEFTINVYNSGSILATGFRLEDVLPPSLAVLSTMPSGFANVATNSVTWPIPDIPVGQYVQLKIVARAVSSGTAVNSGAITAGTVPNQGDTTFASPNLTILPAEASTVNVGITGFVSDVQGAVLGDPVRYTLDIANAGSTPATGVQVTVSISGDMTGAQFQAHTQGVSYDAAQKKVTYVAGSMGAAGSSTATRQVSWSFTYNVPGLILHTANLVTNEQNLASNTQVALANNIIQTTVALSLGHSHSAGAKGTIEYGFPVTYYTNVSIPTSYPSQENITIDITLDNLILVNGDPSNDVFNGGNETLTPSKGGAIRIGKVVRWTLPVVAGGSTETLTFTVTYNDQRFATKTTSAWMTLASDPTFSRRVYTELICTSGENLVDLTLDIISAYSGATAAVPFDLIVRLGNNGGTEVTDATNVNVRMLFDKADGFTNILDTYNDKNINILFDPNKGSDGFGQWEVSVFYPLVAQGTVANDAKFQCVVGCALNDEYSFNAEIIGVSENNAGATSASDGPRTITGSSTTTVENLWHPSGSGNNSTKTTQRLVGESILTPADKTSWDALNIGDVAFKFDPASAYDAKPIFRFYCTELDGQFPVGDLYQPGPSADPYAERHQVYLGNGARADIVNLEAENVNGTLIRASGSGRKFSTAGELTWQRPDGDVRVLGGRWNRVQQGIVFDEGSRNGLVAVDIEDIDGYNVVSVSGEGSYFTSGGSRYAWPEPNNSAGIEISNIRASGPSSFVGGPYYVVALKDGVYGARVHDVSLDDAVGRGLILLLPRKGATSLPVINYQVQEGTMGPGGPINTSYATSARTMHRVEDLNLRYLTTNNVEGSQYGRIVDMRPLGLLKDVAFRYCQFYDGVGIPSAHATQELHKAPFYILSEAEIQYDQNAPIYTAAPEIENLEIRNTEFKNFGVALRLRKGIIGRAGQRGIYFQACDFRRQDPDPFGMNWAALQIIHGDSDQAIGPSYGGQYPLEFGYSAFTGRSGGNDRMVIEDSYNPNNTWAPVSYRYCTFTNGIFQFGPNTTFYMCNISNAAVYWPGRLTTPTLGLSFGLTSQGNVSMTANSKAPAWLP